MKKLMVMVMVSLLAQGVILAGPSASEVARIQKLTKQGDSRAQYNLGVMHSYGNGVPQDHAKAVFWLQKAAKQGHAEAQYWSWHKKITDDAMKNAEQNFAEKRAAEHGNAAAQYSLRVKYYNGQGVVRDRQKGCDLIRASVKQGNKPAIEMYNEYCATK